MHTATSSQAPLLQIVQLKGYGRQMTTVEHTKHAAPLPDGMSEMKNDGYHSGGSGKGGHDSHPGSGEGKGLGAHGAGALGVETFRKAE
jgi:hypothetical protein